MDDDQIIYPVERLLRNPRVFHAVADFLGGPDGETLREAFYDLLEYDFKDMENPEECVFEANEVCFKSIDGGACLEIILDSGIASRLEAIEGEVRANISHDSEMSAMAAIYQRLVTAIEEAHPELKGNIALCSPPTPGNHYLRSLDSDRFEGSFHLLSDPDSIYAFNIEIVDVKNDKLNATIKPI